MSQLILAPLPPEPAVAVIVPARNSAATLRAAVASALSQDTTGPLTVTIAVGPSHDNTRDVADALAAEHANVTVVDNPTGTTPAALNRAVSASRGQVVVRLDAHAELPAGYAARAVELLRETGAANVGGMQVPEADDGMQAAIAAAMRSPVGAGGARYRVGGQPGPVDTVYLGVFRRDALVVAGGFDEALIRNQDYELNHRLRELGGTVYFHPDLAVTYRPRPTLRALARQYHEYGRWKRVVARLHPGSLRLRQLLPPLFVVGLVVAAIAALITGHPLLLVVPAAAYLAALLVAGALADPVRAPLVAAALAVMHLVWAVGFLRGGPPGAPRRSAD